MDARIISINLEESDCYFRKKLLWIINFKIKMHYHIGVWIHKKEKFLNLLKTLVIIVKLK